MANIFINLLTRRVADKYYNIKQQLHKTVSTIRFNKRYKGN